MSLGIFILDYVSQKRLLVTIAETIDFRLMSGNDSIMRNSIESLMSSILMSHTSGIPKG